MEMQDFSGRHFLIVDDESLVRETLADQFTLRGATVVEASDGNEAFQLLLEQEFDAVLSDIRMPECSGIDLLRLVQNSKKKMPPVIMMSAFNDVSSEQLKNLGARSFFMKSGGFQKIEVAIADLLSSNNSL